MKRSVLFSAIAASALFAADVDLGVVNVIEKAHTEVLENVSGDEVKSADLAEALHREVPSINMIRRSGIANDIVLRGQKRDNIAVTIDDAKIYGGCPNRMDPPSSHVLTSNIDKVIVSEGPFDVSTFGTLSGSVKVETKKPKKGFQGDVSINVGSFGYQKAAATVGGGTDTFKYLLTGSTESSDQYEDGDGKTLSDQITAKAPTFELQNRYKTMKAFEKDTFMSKFFINLSDNQELELSYTLNRSDNVLYANSKMDALYDDSDIINLRYTVKGLASWSKKLQVKAYNSKVDHPMTTAFRENSDGTALGEDSDSRTVSALTTSMTGFKIINDTDLNGATLTTGLDTSIRNWDGTYTKYVNATLNTTMTGRKSINNVDTTNNAFFAKYSKKMDKLKLTVGTRFNDTTISSANTTYSDRSFDSVDANVRATYKTDKKTSYFFGLGQASRVPDARELYFSSIMTADTVLIGTPTLKQTTNTEIDLGINKKYRNGSSNLKLFYSKLENYIYYNANTAKLSAANAVNVFENIDATIYGVEIKGRYDLSDSNYFKLGATYQRGQKDTMLTGQTDKDLADITPLKGTLSFNHEPDDYTHYKVEFVAANSWDNYDADNGEQAIAGYAVMNLKARQTFKKNFEVIIGMDNAFNNTYAVSNTYSDLTLLSDGTTSEVMLLNEPGRYFYTNLKYKF